MIVLVDVGNTRTKYCFVNEGKRTKVLSILTTQVTELFLAETFKTASRLLVASVSHELITEKIKEWCQTNRIPYQRVVSEKQKNTITSGYEIPNQLGVDRWLTLIGAANSFPNSNILIIDAGTATTVDLVLATGEHKGGWILAGINTLISSVLAKTVQVKAEGIQNNSTEFGLNTSDNVNNAALAATVGMVNLAISQIEAQRIVIDKIIFTGGNGQLLSSIFPHHCNVIDELVFLGLQAYI